MPTNAMRDPSGDTAMLGEYPAFISTPGGKFSSRRVTGRFVTTAARDPHWSAATATISDNAVAAHGRIRIERASRRASPAAGMAAGSDSAC